MASGKHFMGAWGFRVFLKVFQIFAFKLLELPSFQVTAITHIRDLAGDMNPTGTVIPAAHLDLIRLTV